MKTEVQKKILVVDDDPGIVELLCFLLEDHYTVNQAFGGREALDKVATFKPDLVLLDYMMPDMTGLDVLKLIKKEYNISFVVIVTGKGSETLAVDLMKAGASDYITKPFRNDQLLEVIRNVLRIREVTLKNWELNDELLEANKRLQETAHSLEQTNLNLERRLDELSRLQKMSSNINRVLEIEPLLDELLVSLRNHFFIEHSFIALFDHQDPTVVHTSSAMGFFATDKDLSMMLKYPPVRTALSSLTITIISFSGEREDVHPILEHSTCAIILPLISDGNLIGLYYGENDRAEMFDVDNHDLLSTISNQMAIAVKNAQLFEQLSKSYLDTTFALATAVEAKDQVTKGHIERVTRYAIQVGLALGLNDDEIRILQFGATLHDIGKIGIRDDILLKPGRLDDYEMTMIKMHPVIGENIIASIEFLESVRPIVRHHHERWDGGGYPDGLAHDEIPLYARIISIVDVFDVLTHDRPYKKALSWQEAIQELKTNAGTQFDPELLDLFIAHLDRFPLMPKNNGHKLRMYPT